MWQWVAVLNFGTPSSSCGFCCGKRRFVSPWYTSAHGFHLIFTVSMQPSEWKNFLPSPLWSQNVLFCLLYFRRLTCLIVGIVHFGADTTKFTCLIKHGPGSFCYACLSPDGFIQVSGRPSLSLLLPFTGMKGFLSL